MIRPDRTGERLGALFMLGAVLLLPPVLLVFDQPVLVAGIPLLYLYLFVAWSMLVLLTAAAARRIGRGGTPAPPTPHAAPPGDA